MSESNADKIKESIAALEAQRGTLGDSVVDPAVAALRQQLAQLTNVTQKPAAEDERKIVTIVFADISGLTALSEKKDPEEVRALMNTCFESLVPVVQKYEGTIDKFIGDEIMALFGAPIGHEDDPERALRAALEMMKVIAEVNRAHGTELEIHIGINSGAVIAGQIGAKNRRDYSVIGDAVNLAARLEDASSSGEILVGPGTYQRTAHLFDFEPIPPLTLKGKEAPVEVHRLIRAKATAKSARGIAGLPTQLVGRESELDRIRSAFKSLQEGRGSVCAVLGEAGVGKSRLVAEARDGAREKFDWAEGRALSYTVGMSYWLSRAVLCDLLGIESDAEPKAVAARLRRAIEQELPKTFDEVYPYLAPLFELLLEGIQERVRFLSTEALQARILQAVQEYIHARAKRHPLVLVWEDMHWSDPSSLEVFQNLLPLINKVPLLLICIARSDENPATELLNRTETKFRENFQRIELSLLTREQSRSLFEQFLKIDNQETRTLILDRAEGNPFFLEELIRSLRDSGVLRIEQSHLVATREIKAIDVPDTVQATVMTRIDRLAPSSKSTLQRASVIGRIFQERILVRLQKEDGAKLADSLDELQRREFVRLTEETPTDDRDRKYLFRHAIIYEVAYNSMLLARRKDLHKIVAETLEQLFPDRRQDLCATIGFHFERAEAHEQAASYLGRAAERAKATFANAEAIGFYESAIRATEHLLLANDAPEHQHGAFQLNEGLGDLFTLIGEQEKARAIFQRALDFLSKIDIVGRARIYRKIGFGHSLQRHFAASEEALAKADRILDQGATEPDTAWWNEKLQIQLERMQLFYWQGMVPEMQQLAENYRVAIERNGSATQQARFLKQLALALLMESRFRPTAECVELARRAVGASEGIPDLWERCYVRFTLGLIQLFRCDLDEAVAALSAALELAQRIGERILESRSLTYLALAHRRRGNVDQARILADRAAELATKLAMTEYIAMSKANLAWVAWKQSRLDDCDLLGKEALELWHAMANPYSMDWIALWPMIGSALAKQKIAQAVELAKGLFRDGQHPIEEEVMSETRNAIDSETQPDPAVSESQLWTAFQTAERFRYV
ncbi:MAG: hypothetical protein DME93_08740 [Verrucomicrobia bacterium]|nr:MAG: hypothetical protein DME93_08740 [Verrucomicrobiota bacterium]